MELPIEQVADAPVIGTARTTLRSTARGQVFLRNGLQLLVLISLALGSYLFISKFLLCSVQVVGVSMQPTLQDHERCLLNRWIFYVREPKRGDIIVIRDPADNGFSVKRVVGVQGDRIHLGRGDLVINGKLVQEPYLPARTLTFPKPTVKEQDIVCGKDQFVVMGDNRMNSADSRHYGPVPRNRVLGLLVQ